MKKIALFLALIALSACSVGPNKIYEIQVVYVDSKVDTLRFSGTGDNRFAILQGDLQHLRGVTGNHEILASGVRQFFVFNIKTVTDTNILRNIKSLQ